MSEINGSQCDHCGTKYLPGDVKSSWLSFPKISEIYIERTFSAFKQDDNMEIVKVTIPLSSKDFCDEKCLTWCIQDKIHEQRKKVEDKDEVSSLPIG